MIAQGLDFHMAHMGDVAQAQISSLIRTHFELGGTQINMNVLDTQKLLEAYEEPSKYPDLVVRVTGFSAYFSSLSLEFRKMVIDRLITAEAGHQHQPRSVQ